MASTPKTNNVFIEIADGVIKAAISGGGDGVRVYLATTPAAFLLGPVIRVFTNKIIDIFGDALYQNFHDVAAKVIIDIQTNLEKSNVKGALDTLKSAISSGDAEKLKKAKADYEKAIGDLIHSDGSRSR